MDYALDNTTGDEWNQKAWEDLVLKVKETMKIKSYNFVCYLVY